MEEIWKEVKGLEGYYQVSNKGRVKCLRHGKEKIKSATKFKSGYLMVRMMLKGKLTRYYVHRLVADSFLSEIVGKDVVNHIDGDKLNNCIENLEYTNSRENVSHGKNKMYKSSKYTGVNFCKIIGLYRSRIFINKKSINLGSFKNEIDAHNAYQKALEDNNLKNKYSIS